MSHRLRLILICCLLTLVSTAHAFYDDYEDDEDYDEDQPRKAVRVDTPRDRYDAKLDILNAQVERRRQICKLSRAQAADFCVKEADQYEREGRYKLKKELEEALAKAGGEAK